MYIKLQRIFFVCVGWGGGGRDGRGGSLILNCVCGWEREGDGEGDHLFQTALKNVANKYFHYGQFLNIVLCGVGASPINGLWFESQW